MEKRLLFFLIALPMFCFPQKILHEVNVGNGKRAYLYESGKWAYKLYEADPSEFVDTPSKLDSDTISSFYGIKFGLSFIAVKDAMKAKGYSPFSENDGVLLGYSNVSFGGRTPMLMLFKFDDSTFFEGSVFFKHDLESRTLDLYNDIKEDVTSKYGDGESYESYDYPYEKSDGHWETALKLGKAHISTFWVKHSGAAIQLEVTNDFSIELSYQDKKLIKQVVNKQQSKALEDY